jgi:hypothetical protein
MMDYKADPVVAGLRGPNLGGVNGKAKVSQRAEQNVVTFGLA